MVCDLADLSVGDREPFTAWNPVAGVVRQHHGGVKDGRVCYRVRVEVKRIMVW